MDKISLNNKVSNLIQYLKELTQLRQKPVYSYKNYEKIMWIDHLPIAEECNDGFRNDIDYWLHVRKPVFPAFPKIPKELKEWLEIDPKNQVLNIKKSILKSDNKEVLLKNQVDMQKQITSFQENDWNPFILKYNQVNDIHTLYDTLFKMYQELENNSESIELVVSVGLLQWKVSAKETVERHLLTAKAELFFDKERAEMMIIPSSKGVEFIYEEDMLLVENRLSGVDHTEIQSLLDTFHEDNTIKQNLPTVLKSILNALDPRGEFIDSIGIPKLSSEDPMLSISPAFILRKKTQRSVQYACDLAVDQLSVMDESAIPVNMANMFLSEPIEAEEVVGDEILGKTEQYYFPLPSNEEQNRIITSLNKQNNVLVQGPPGTGKTHTIANLTAHLLATGQRVLITSQTAKALSVLKGKLPKGLQDLSVSLLGGDAASMKDLEDVISTISVNKERFDLAEMVRAIDKNELALEQRKEALNETKLDLMKIREAEMYDHTFDGAYSGTAQTIAKQINTEEHLYDWYTTDLPSVRQGAFKTREKELVSEYIKLKNSKIEVPTGFNELEYPRLKEAIDLENITNHINDEQILKSEYDGLIKDENLIFQEQFKEYTVDEVTELQSVLAEYKVLVKPLLFNTYPKLTKVLDDIFKNRGYMWNMVGVDLTAHLKVINDMKDSFDPNLVSAEGATIAVLKQMTEDLLVHFNAGGKMGNFLFQPKIVKQHKQTLDVVTYNGLPIKSVEDVKRIHAYIQTKAAYESIGKLIVPHLLNEKPFAMDFAFAEYKNVLLQLKEALKIEQWRTSIINKYTFLSADTFTKEQLDALQDNIELYLIRNRLVYKSDQIENSIENVKKLIVHHTDELYSNLTEVLKERDVEAIESIWQEYEAHQIIVNYNSSLERISLQIEKTSPEIFEELARTYMDAVWKERLIVWDKAQYWKERKGWLDSFSEKNEAVLLEKYDEIEKDVRARITEIGTAKAWINMLSTMTDSQSRHLKAWNQSVKNIGKGTGKNASRYIIEAQKHMEECKDAIPAWIMPLDRVFENFEIRPNLFDIVIVDEASQSWHDALLLKYLAKKMIIVGDDKQISPSVVGIKADDINKLYNKYLKSIDFKFANTLNAVNSFFDVSYIMFKETITLREHFRCMPEIIGFSNLISYSSNPLIPLRQYPTKRLEPIISRYLPHGKRVGSADSTHNEVEADEIVKEIVACINNSEYDGKTIGVISLLGNNQANIIQSKLINIIGAEVMEEREIICGDAYAFQGDERDIVFISMVAAKGSTRVTALTSNAVRQRFNVAISRAKDQLWVMHSLSVNDISNHDCLRYQLLSYIESPLKEEAEMDRKKCSNRFEEDVFDAVAAKGYYVIPQYNVAKYRIDLVVVGEYSKLAIACDGDHWYTNTEDREQDFLRERVLERAGWRFWRVLGSEYYNNREESLTSLWKELTKMDIKPYKEWKESVAILDTLEDVTVKEDSSKEKIGI